MLKKQQLIQKWLCLPVQETRVRALIQEDHTFPGAISPRAAASEEPMLRKKSRHCGENPCTSTGECPRQQESAPAGRD